MKKLTVLLISIFFLIEAYPQHFFDTGFNKRKKYVVLVNPTVHNIETIQYLVNNGLLNINTNKLKFVGVYFCGQNYDFSKTKKYISENELDDFYLHEIGGELTENNLFEKNACSGELENVFEKSVGVFFFGGPDIPPGVYGEKNSYSDVTDPARHYFELTFMYHLVGGYQDENFEPFLQEKPGYVVSGICLGMQTLNVATGGTLIQDIPAELFGATTPEATIKIGRTNLHRNYWQKIEAQDTLLMDINLHTIQFTNHPFFGEAVKIPKRWEPRICSHHHQAVDKIGKNLVVTALSPDGKIIEGLAHKRYPNVFAVQFHPEVPALYEDLYERKFHPDDTPLTYNDIIGRQSVKFHKKYWEHISFILKKAKRKR